MFAACTCSLAGCRFAPLGECWKASFDPVEVDEVGTDGAASPDCGIVDLSVAVGSDDPVELGIPARAADILGRTAAGGMKQQRVGVSWESRFNFLYLDRV